MRLTTLALTSALIAACAAPDPGPQQTSTSLADPGLDLGDEDLVLGTPVEVDDLVLWPVLRVADAARPAALLARYLSLDEGLRSGAVEVREKGDVNELLIVNTGDDPVLCLSGEVLEGGQQDRIVAQDTVIEPGQTVGLASFCVEQGRWHTEAGDELKGQAFRTAELFVGGDIKAAAQVSLSQGAVWANVALAQAANSVDSDTGAYLVLRDDPRVRAQVEERRQRILAALESLDGAVGLVAAFDLGGDDEHVTGEVFGDEALYATYRDKLVHAYAFDAVTRAAGPAPEVGVDQLSLGLSLAQSSQVFNDFGDASINIAPTGGLFPAESTENVLVTDDVIEAAGADLRHVHRTLYKRRSSATDSE